MKFEWNSKYATIGLYSFLTIGACILLFVFIKDFAYIQAFAGKLAGLLMPFILGFILAYILNPVLNFIEKKLFPLVLGKKVSRKTRRCWAVLLTMLFALAVIAVFFAIVIPQLVDSVMGLYVQIPPALYALQNRIFTWLERLDIGEQYITQLISLSTQYAEQLVNNAYSFITKAVPHLLNMTINFTSGVLKIVVGLIVCVYLFFAKEKFMAQGKKLLYAFLPQKPVNMLLKLAADSHRIFSGFISGKILDSFIIGVLCYIGLLLIGTPYPLLISLIVGVTNVIPYFGPFIGAVPSALFILLIDPIHCLWFLIFILFLQQLDGNVIGPKILGDSTGLSAFWVIFSITLFGGLWGFIGMLIGVPLFAVIYSVCKSYAEYRLRCKEMATETAAYASEECPLIPEKEKKASSGKRGKKRVLFSNAGTVPKDGGHPQKEDKKQP